MRYAIFSDIHGNLPAWEQSLADMRSLEVDVFVCLGDVVGYGPKPQEVLDGIRAVTEYFVMGNHDAAAAGIIDPSMFNDHARAVVLWTRDQLTADGLSFLNQVPLELQSGNILFVHAEVPDPGRFGYIDTEADAAASFAARDHLVTFVGHTHHPECFHQSAGGHVQKLGDNDMVLDESSRYIINVGSLGEPRNPDDIRARYVIYDDDTRSVYFRRVDFDANIYRQQLIATGLNHKPFFLQVLDNQTLANASARIDMEVPAQAVGSFETMTRKVVLPAAGTIMGSKPKPVPVRPAKKKSGAPLVLSMLVVLLCLAGGGGWFYLQSQSAKPETSELERGDIADTILSKAPVVESNDTDISKTAESKVEAAVVPEPEPDIVSVEKVDLATPKIDIKPEPVATPKPIVDVEDSVEVYSIYWSMDSVDSEKGLVDEQGKTLLEPLLPGKAFKALAPDPVPATKADNNGSMAAGAWVENEPSGNFQLRSDRSFTLEGWVMIAPSQPLLRVAGTTRWKLEMVSAPKPSAQGGIRLIYDNGGGENIVASPIALYEPVAHHVAVVWNHEGIDSTIGDMAIFYDGDLVGSLPLSHSDLGSDDNKYAFSLGAKENPTSFGFDEFRFIHKALTPREFLYNDRDTLVADVPETGPDAPLVNLTFDDSEAPTKNFGTLEGSAKSLGGVAFKSNSNESKSGFELEFSGEQRQGLGIQIAKGSLAPGSDYTFSASVFTQEEQNIGYIVDPFFRIATGSNSLDCYAAKGRHIRETKLPTGWHRLTTTYQHNASLDQTRAGVRVYLDGRLVLSTPHVNRVDLSGGFDIQLGNNQAGTAGAFKGRLDDVRFFAKAVTPVQAENPTFGDGAFKRGPNDGAPNQLLVDSKPILFYRSGRYQLDNWSIYNDNVEAKDRVVTPLLLEDVGTNDFTIVAIGKTQTADAQTKQNFSFEAVEGVDVIDSTKGKYHLGFRFNDISGSKNHGAAFDFLPSRLSHYYTFRNVQGTIAAQQNIGTRYDQTPATREYSVEFSFRPVKE